MTGFTFNTANVEESHFDAMPAGDYAVQAVELKMQDTKSGVQMLKVKFEVVDGPFKGRKIIEYFNVLNQNPATVEIAQRDLKAWIRACGVADDVDVDFVFLNTLCGREFLAGVKIEKDKTGQYDDENRIKRYKPLNTQRAQPAPVATPAPAAAPAAKKPWE